MTEPIVVHTAAVEPIAGLKPHPRNYRSHPDDQRQHIVRSLSEHGMYRNVIAARDGTILAGHGVIEAARDAGLDEVPVVRLDVEPDSAAAIRVLTGDNFLEHLAVDDDRLLADLLREVRDIDVDGLIGTGFDDQMLAALVYVTRPESEVASRDDADQWVGMPEFDPVGLPFKIVVNCETEAGRLEAMEALGSQAPTKKYRGVWSCWWPPRGRLDIGSVRFNEPDDDPDETADAEGDDDETL